MAGMRISEIGQLIGKEWKALSSGDRKVGRRDGADRTYLADIGDRNMTTCKLVNVLVTW